MTAAVARPNPDIIPLLEQVYRMGKPTENTSGVTTRLKTIAYASIALGVSSFYMYKRFNSYAALTGSVGALALLVFAISRVIIKKEKSFDKKDLPNLSQKIISELHSAWQSKSAVLCDEFNQLYSKVQAVETAKFMAEGLSTSYDDPKELFSKTFFACINDPQKEWRKTYQLMTPHVKKIFQLDVDDISEKQELDPNESTSLRNIHTAATYFLYGDLAQNISPYVEIRELNSGKSNPTFMAQQRIWFN